MAACARMPIDGLSRCLCPSIDAFLLSPRHRPALSSVPSRKNGCSRDPWPCRARAVHTEGSQLPSISKHPIYAVDLDNPTRRGFSRALAGAPLGAVYKALHDARGSSGQARRIRLLVRWLVERRRQRPNIMLYEALVVANWSPSGSAVELKALVEEMRRTGVEPTWEFFHAMLRVCWLFFFFFVFKRGPA